MRGIKWTRPGDGPRPRAGETGIAGWLGNRPPARAVIAKARPPARAKADPRVRRRSVVVTRRVGLRRHADEHRAEKDCRNAGPQQLTDHSGRSSRCLKCVSITGISRGARSDHRRSQNSLGRILGQDQHRPCTFLASQPWPTGSIRRMCRAAPFVDPLTHRPGDARRYEGFPGER